MTKVTECSGNVDAWQKYVRPMALAAPRQVLYRVVFMKSNDDS
jgi:hypothetical protein